MGDAIVDRLPLGRSTGTAVVNADPYAPWHPPGARTFQVRDRVRIRLSRESGDWYELRAPADGLTGWIFTTSWKPVVPGREAYHYGVDFECGPLPAWAEVELWPNARIRGIAVAAAEMELLE